MNGNGNSGFFEEVHRRTVGATEPSRNGQPAIGDAEAFPCLATLLTSLPKGAVRGSTTGAVLLFVQNGRLTARLTIPSMLKVSFFALDSLQDVARDLETGLRDGKVEWREDRKAGRK